jgi:hypothetical protein
MGSFRRAPWHHVSSAILRHSRANRYVSLVLIEKIRPSALGLAVIEPFKLSDVNSPRLAGTVARIFPHFI